MGSRVSEQLQGSTRPEAGDGVSGEDRVWGAKRRSFAWAEEDRKPVEARPFLTWSVKEEEAGELAQQLHYPMFF